MSLLNDLLNSKQSIEEIMQLANHQNLVKQMIPKPYRKYLNHCLPMFESFFWYQEQLINTDELSKLNKGQPITFFPMTTLPMVTKEKDIDLMMEYRLKEKLSEDDILSAWVLSGKLKADHLPILKRKGLSDVDAIKIGKALFG